MKFGFLYLIYNIPQSQALALSHYYTVFAYGQIFSWNMAAHFFSPPNFKTKKFKWESLGNLKESAIDLSENVNILSVSLTSKDNFLLLSRWFMG